MLRSALALTALLALGGCVKHVGTSVKDFRPATGPRGVLVNVELRGSRIPGELLEVQDSALLVLQLDVKQVVLVPLREIRSAVFHQRGLLIYRGAFLDERTAAELRLLSRYPAGLTPALLATLLAGYGQTEPRPPLP